MRAPWPRRRALPGAKPAAFRRWRSLPPLARSWRGSCARR
ncbi:3-alpha domain-containing protein [Pseudomonas sp. MYb187]